MPVFCDIHNAKWKKRKKRKVLQNCFVMEKKKSSLGLNGNSNSSPNIVKK